eukprot:TRINITY_DN13678_c0_g1_i6.p1 TRINITY_DN13678_c0_g1~~TRINITY_DN13678_c0_g1_i6.p1  ORF type:complete len:385 (-),score=34.05 TRINITY_DN13678_c0_g1_i6:246-1400(-)
MASSYSTYPTVQFLTDDSDDNGDVDNESSPPSRYRQCQRKLKGHESTARMLTLKGQTPASEQFTWKSSLTEATQCVSPLRYTREQCLSSPPKSSLEELPGIERSSADKLAAPERPTASCPTQVVKEHGQKDHSNVKLQKRRRGSENFQGLEGKNGSPSHLAAPGKKTPTGREGEVAYFSFDRYSGTPRADACVMISGGVDRDCMRNPMETRLPTFGILASVPAITKTSTITSPSIEDSVDDTHPGSELHRFTVCSSDQRMAERETNAHPCPSHLGREPKRRRNGSEVINFQGLCPFPDIPVDNHVGETKDSDKSNESAGDSGLAQKLREEDEGRRGADDAVCFQALMTPGFVLSSGRGSVRAMSIRKRLTIDDEFERFFSKLLV